MENNFLVVQIERTLIKFVLSNAICVVFSSGSRKFWSWSGGFEVDLQFKLKLLFRNQHTN